MRPVALAFAFSFALTLALPAARCHATQTEPPQSATPDSLVAWFDRAWAFALRWHYDTLTVQTMLTEENRQRMTQRAATLSSRNELAHELNRFLDSAGFSHTGVYTPRDLEYWVLSRMGTHDLATPATWHIGAMFAPGPSGWTIRNVLEGYPAALAGLRRGDVIVRTSDGPFHPFDSFAHGRKATLRVQRGQRLVVLVVSPVFEGPLESFRQATLNSIQRRTIDGRSVGIVHLWCCTNSEMRDALRAAVFDSLAGCDGLVLDLRDGFGGSYEEYLDLFYPDRSQSVLVSSVMRGKLGGSQRAQSGPAHPCFRGALVAVVNEGTRSAKELIAFNLQRSGRATLVGERTSGALCSVAWGYADGEHRMIVEVPGSELFLDGERIEGIGVAPDRLVPWPLAPQRAGDPQLDAALDAIKAKLSR